MRPVRPRSTSATTLPVCMAAENKNAAADGSSHASARAGVHVWPTTCICAILTVVLIVGGGRVILIPVVGRVRSIPARRSHRRSVRNMRHVVARSTWGSDLAVDGLGRGRELHAARICAFVRNPHPTSRRFTTESALALYTICRPSSPASPRASPWVRRDPDEISHARSRLSQISLSLPPRSPLGPSRRCRPR